LAEESEGASKAADEEEELFSAVKEAPEVPDLQVPVDMDQANVSKDKPASEEARGEDEKTAVLGKLKAPASEAAECLSPPPARDARAGLEGTENAAPVEDETKV
jgi:hypothetical protein